MIENRQGNKEADRLRQELSDLIYKISHDLNGPLRHINELAKYIKSDESENLSRDTVNHLDKIMLSSKQVSGILKGILSLSRINTRQSEYEKVDFNALVKELLYERQVFEEVSEDVRFKTKSLPVIECDKGQVTIALSALLENAFLYKEKDRPNVVTIDGWMDSEAARVIITDTGIGFDQKHVDEIVRPLTRRVAQSEYAGYGMGLAIADQVMQRHNGILKLESVAGNGTTAILIFPLGG